jgi:hypothetical protein
MAKFLAVDNAMIAAFDALLFMVYRGIQRLGLLQAFAADGCFQVVTGKKTVATLATFQAVHLALWFPASENSHSSLLTGRNNQRIYRYADILSAASAC